MLGGAEGDQKHPFKVDLVLGSLKYQVVISILTIYTLFFDDFRTALFDADVDIYYDVIGLIILAFFTL